MSEDELQARAREWPEERVLFLEPTRGVPPGQPDTMVWLRDRWVQLEFKYEAARPPGMPDPSKLFRPAQRKRVIKSALRGIPYYCAILRDAVELRVKGQKVVSQEVELWQCIQRGQVLKRSWVELGRIELRDFDPDSIALLINSVPTNAP